MEHGATERFCCGTNLKVCHALELLTCLRNFKCVMNGAEYLHLKAQRSRLSSALILIGRGHITRYMHI
mgnify:CR=1 FL=1